MNRPLLAVSLLAGLVLGGCGHRDAPPARAAARVDWRNVATVPDRARIRDWRGAWSRALAQVNAAGRARDVMGAGALFRPDAALEGPAPPPGDYDCRVTKLGARGPGMLDYVAYPPFRCRIARDGDALGLAKVGGSQRPVGLLYPDDPQRMVFLGTMLLSDERVAQQYGRDPERDMIGVFERIGPARWRLVLPWPRWESNLDVLELVPAA